MAIRPVLRRLSCIWWSSADRSSRTAGRRTLEHAHAVAHARRAAASADTVPISSAHPAWRCCVVASSNTWSPPPIVRWFLANRCARFFGTPVAHIRGQWDHRSGARRPDERTTIMSLTIAPAPTRPTSAPTTVPTTPTPVAYRPVAFDLYHDIHKGIHAELLTLTADAGRLDPADECGLAALAAQVQPRSSTSSCSTPSTKNGAIQPVLERGCRSWRHRSPPKPRGSSRPAWSPWCN